MHLRVALARYARQLEADGRSPHTVAQARRQVGLLLAWLDAGNGPTTVRRLTHEHVAEFLRSPALHETHDGRPRKASSANVCRTILRCFGRYLVDSGYARANPCRLVRLARCQPAPPRSLSEAEARRLLAAIDAQPGDDARRDGMLVRLMLATGLRLGSALALRVEDVDLERGQIVARVVKGDRPGTVPVTRELTRVLGVFLGDRKSGLLFPGYSGNPLSSRQAGRGISLYARKCGLAGKATAHSLRHTAGQRVYDRTNDILLVQRLLGHRDLASSAIYARADDRRLRDALTA